jgi:hypothetical protein
MNLLTPTHPPAAAWVNINLSINLPPIIGKFIMALRDYPIISGSKIFEPVAGVDLSSGLNIS